MRDKVLKIADVNLCKVPHLTEAELEDLYDKDMYGPAFQAEFGVDPRKKPLGKPKVKWSGIMEKLFAEAGRPWDDPTKIAVKFWLAEFVAQNAENILKEPLTGPLKSFLQTAEDKMPTASSSQPPGVR